jgi:hypothetical protein
LRSYPNLLNAAICLERLDRKDEAFEVYEELLRDFKAQLSTQQVAIITAKVNDLRTQVGSIKISSNVDARIVVDERERGTLPRQAPISLMRGERHVRIIRDGYVPFEITVDVPANALLGVSAQIRRVEAPPGVTAEEELQEEPQDITPIEHTEPPRPVPNRFRGAWYVGAFGGYGGGFSLRSDAELKAISTCTTACPGAHGSLLGMRGGYLFNFGLALELTGGYVTLSSSFERKEQSRFTPTAQTDPTLVTYILQDNVRFQGGFGGIGISYRGTVVPSVNVLTRITAGLISARSADGIRASATRPRGAARRTPPFGWAVPPLGPNDSAEAFIAGKSQVLSSQPGFVMPEIGMEVERRRIRLGLFLGVLFIPANGPAFGRREIGFDPKTCGSTSTVACTPNSKAIVEERAYGPVQVWVPQFAVGYTFEAETRHRTRRR